MAAYYPTSGNTPPFGFFQFLILFYSNSSYWSIFVIIVVTNKLKTQHIEEYVFNRLTPSNAGKIGQKCLGGAYSLALPTAYFIVRHGRNPELGRNLLQNIFLNNICVKSILLFCTGFGSLQTTFFTLQIFRLKVNQLNKVVYPWG